jgi:hypothetical protein
MTTIGATTMGTGEDVSSQLFTLWYHHAYGPTICEH